MKQNSIHYNNGTGPDGALQRERGEELRQEEWEMARQLLAAARTHLRRLRLPESDVSPSEISRLLDLASRLGRLSTGLAQPREEFSEPQSNSVQDELRAALHKVYGLPTAEERQAAQAAGASADAPP